GGQAHEAAQEDKLRVVNFSSIAVVNFSIDEHKAGTCESLVVRPGPQNLHHVLVFKHLVDEPVLNVDAP
ncbi:MAG: hypothetical protein XD74_1699, partial [Actinobacteria bacterium 66_15]